MVDLSGKINCEQRGMKPPEMGWWRHAKLAELLAYVLNVCHNCHRLLRASKIASWWFGTMEFDDFPYIGNVITPTDELHDFSEG